MLLRFWYAIKNRKKTKLIPSDDFAIISASDLPGFTFVLTILIARRTMLCSMLTYLFKTLH